MAVFPVSNTFCEVTYDSDWYEDDRHLTPYRYSLLRSDTDSNSDTVSLTLPSYTYYEYLRSLYDCRTTATGRIPPGYPGSSREHLFENPERARTWHAFGKDTGSELSRAAIRSEPTKIRPTYPFPSLHLIQQGGDSADEYDEEYAFTDRTKQKLVWVDALNKWVPENQLNPRPYMTFIGNAPMIEKTGRSLHKEDIRSRSQSAQLYKMTFGGGEAEEVPVCERFELHMGKLTSLPKPPSNKQRNNEKRDAIRKRAQELAEQRKQRKAYSSPLYTTLTERSKKITEYKKRAQSSKAPHTKPTSPVQKDVTPVPKPPREAWQPNEGDRLRAQTATPPPISPVKREISITLVKAEDTEQEPVDQPDAAKTDKKVKFLEENKPVVEKPKSPKKKKDPDEVSKEELEAKLAQQRLKESLEKQRQQQILEQQRILKERELEQERERKEKELLEEQERLKKLKSLEKRPLSQKNNNHENYYENTMNAADHLFSQKDQTQIEKENKKNVKLCEVKKPAEIKNKKNSQLTPVPKKVKTKNVSNKDQPDVADKQHLDPVITSTDTSKNVKENLKETKVETKVEAKIKQVDSGLVKVVDPADKVVVEVDLVPVSKGSKGQGRKQKGKGKSQKTKTTKTQKSKTIDPEQIKPKKGLLKPMKRENTFPPVKSSKTIKLKNAKRKLSEQLTRQFKEKTHTTPRPKPVLAGVGKPPVTIPALSPRQQEPVKPEIPLPISAPSEIKLDDDEIEAPKPQSAHRERRKSIVQQREVIKKEKRDSRKCVKKDEVESQKLPEIETDVRKIESWIYGAEDYSDKQSDTTEKADIQVEVLPSLTQDLNPELVEKKIEVKEKRRKSVLANLIATENNVKKWRKPGPKDSSYLDELRRLELAEERRKKQMEMFERLKNRKQSIFGYSTEDGSPGFEDYGFLAKYCIFTKGNIDMYRHAYDAVDDSKAGWLEGQDVMIALRGVNNKLTEAEEEYLYRVLELTGYQITHGADFKMFSVLAALSQRISALDKWMKNFIGKMDFKQLEMKMFKCKTLWECNVDKDTNCIPLDQLCVELRAGGVSLEHEIECREKLSHLPSLDLLDFLTYVPLFIMIHESVVKNPLDDSRSK